MWHPTLIVLHAGGGLVAFLTGCLAFARRSYLDAYLASLAACVLFLLVLVAFDWTRLSPTSHVLFAALSALGGYMLWRAAQARRIAIANPTTRSVRELNHLGFTLVALLTRSSSSVPSTSARPTGSSSPPPSPSPSYDTH